jgi:hypothetical protein
MNENGKIYLTGECRNCTFCYTNYDHEHNCVKNPPVVLPDGQTRWPVIPLDGWCGEFLECVE